MQTEPIHKPLIYRLVNTIVFFQSVVGILFYSLILFTDSASMDYLPEELGLSGHDSTAVWYTYTNLFLHLGLLISGVLLYQFRLSGFYLFVSLMLSLIILNSFILSNAPFVTSSFGLFILIPLVFYVKKMR